MSPEARRLEYWEEAVGLLGELEEKDEFILARISKVSIVLPLEMEEKLRPHVKKQIGLLHTDIPSKPYLLRVVSDQEKTNSE